MFRSYAKLLFSANEMPVTLDEKSGAFFRRMLVIEVKERGAEIPGLKKGLKDSMPGLIRECVAALNRQYLSGKEIDSQNSKESVHELFRESDSVTAFLDDCTEKVPGERVDRLFLYRKYENYCYSNELTPINNRSFYRNLRSKGYSDFMSNGSRYFKDMCCKVLYRAESRADFEDAMPQENAVFMGKSG